MVPLTYSYRNLRVRWKTTLATAACFMFVTAALIVMLAFLQGVQSVSIETGEPQNVLCLQKGVTDEVFSRINTELAVQIESAAGALDDAGRRPRSSRELFMAVMNKAGDLQTELIQVRGVDAAAFQVHSQVQVVRGEMFPRNSRQVLIGAAVARRKQLNLGDPLRIGRGTWTVGGVFAANGTAFESEVWVDRQQLAGDYHRQGIVTSVVLRFDHAKDAAWAAPLLQESRQAATSPYLEPKYYEQQSEQTRVLSAGSVVIGLFMGLGAVLGVMNTMFAAIAARITDVALLRLFGFSRLQILAVFLLESLMIAVIGGAVGIVFGCAVNGLSLTTAVGGREVAFMFDITYSIIGSAIVCTLLLGVLGGLFPAMFAMRIKPLEAFR